MKIIAIVIPANIFRAPYINYFTDVLKVGDVKFDFIFWDKEGVEENGITFRMQMSSKSNFIKKFYYYHMFTKFIEKKLEQKKYDYIIVHTLQLGIFLQKFLCTNYKKRYLVDIRDYSILSVLKRPLIKLLKNSKYNFISSEGFKMWLPQNIDYILSHNIKFENQDTVQSKNVIINGDKKIKLSTIGSLRDKEITLSLIDCLKNSSKIDLHFFGDGPISSDLKKLSLKNLKYHGRYKKKEEEKIYKSSDLINIVLPTNNINSRTLMPNRFYNALKFEKIILTTEGTYLAKMVKEYNLGIVINLNKGYNLENSIVRGIEEMDWHKYSNGKARIMSKIEEDINYFEESLRQIIK
ncbi:hypothetical protein [Cetobacterium sp.]